MQVDTPGEVYDRPARQFVASFVGSPGMNLIECEVVLKETTIQIRSAGGGETFSHSRSVHPGDAALPLHEHLSLLLGIRTESVKLTDGSLVDPQKGGIPLVVLPAIVRGVEYQGWLFLVTLQLTARDFSPGLLLVGGCKKDNESNWPASISRRPFGSIPPQASDWSCIASPPPTR